MFDNRLQHDREARLLSENWTGACHNLGAIAGSPEGCTMHVNTPVQYSLSRPFNVVMHCFLCIRITTL
ncbi:hypothetical protein DPMN_055639 [Dreissena polymorpha]|uniref:Uncharacterized protein n=1 Tax=Dreissena polymorpha TaxID=45954 RepID=A0A9D4CRR2_DREPO|nr:hypothetical protein DPMN_055578 [Dreissena polymorpha]KAH3729661.1 hypothetical protein DPMN_055639 [Dreissena polymorpha]